MDPSSINWLAVIASAFASFLIGGLWYSPVLFARPWMEANGFKEDDLAGRNMAPIFGGAFALALVITINLAFFLGPDAGIAWGAGAGALAGVGWVTASLGIIYLFERRPFKLFAINAGYQIVTYTVAGAILGAW